MSYWVYENWVAESKAVIHMGSCRFCNDGAGTGRNVRGDRNGTWHGAFASLDEADAAALSTGRPVRSCRCVGSQPRSGPSAQPSAAPARDAPTPLDASLGGQKALAEIGFERAGAWRLESVAKSGVRFMLHAYRNDRVVYAFVVDDTVAYIGICDGSGTTLVDRMSRYQNMVGAGTNERVVGLIRQKLSEGREVLIYALKPAPGPKHLNFAVDYIKGLEFPLIERLKPAWNKRR
jgi:hypothetical protein